VSVGIVIIRYQIAPIGISNDVGAVVVWREKNSRKGKRNEKEDKGVLVSWQRYHLLGVYEILHLLQPNLQRRLFTKKWEE